MEIIYLRPPKPPREPPERLPPLKPPPERLPPKLPLRTELVLFERVSVRTDVLLRFTPKRSEALNERLLPAEEASRLRLAMPLLTERAEPMPADERPKALRTVLRVPVGPL